MAPSRPVPSRTAIGADVASIPSQVVREETFVEIDRATISAEDLQRRLDELEADFLAQVAENSQLGEIIAGLESTIRSLGAKLIRLQTEASRAKSADPANDVVRAVLMHWLVVTGRRDRKGRKPSLAMDSKRADVVRKALKMKQVATGQPYTPDQLALALDGLGLLPFVGPKGRLPHGVPAQRYDEVEHALRDEPTIDRFIAYAQRARGAIASDPERMWALRAQISAQEELVYEMLMAELGRREHAMLAATDPDAAEAAATRREKTDADLRALVGDEEADLMAEQQQAEQMATQTAFAALVGEAA